MRFITVVLCYATRLFTCTPASGKPCYVQKAYNTDYNIVTDEKQLALNSIVLPFWGQLASAFEIYPAVSLCV